MRAPFFATSAEALTGVCARVCVLRMQCGWRGGCCAREPSCDGEPETMAPAGQLGDATLACIVHVHRARVPACVRVRNSRRLIGLRCWCLRARRARRGRGCAGVRACMWPCFVPFVPFFVFLYVACMTARSRVRARHIGLHAGRRALHAAQHARRVAGPAAPTALPTRVCCAFGSRGIGCTECDLSCTFASAPAVRVRRCMQGRRARRVVARATKHRLLAARLVALAPPAWRCVVVPPPHAESMHVHLPCVRACSLLVSALPSIHVDHRAAGSRSADAHKRLPCTRACRNNM
jgi:hypothetical protein